MVIMIRFKHNPPQRKKRVTVGQAQFSPRAGDDFDTVKSQWYIFRRRKVKSGLLCVQVVLAGLAGFKHQFAPAFFAGLVQLFFLCNHDLFDARAVGPAGTLPYRQYF
jgi:hypothetical protein